MQATEASLNGLARDERGISPLLLCAGSRCFAQTPNVISSAKHLRAVQAETSNDDTIACL